MTQRIQNGPMPQAQTIESEGQGDHAALLARVVEATRYSVRDLETISKKAAQSRLYGMDENQAFTLMLIAESEGLHPIQALKRYHIIEGRPSMRADAMQAEFQRHGGRLRWIVSTGDECTAEFWHPQYHPEPFTVHVTLKELVDSEVAMQWPKRKEGEPFDARKGKVLKTTYKQYPRQMLRARAISEGVRAIDPGVVVGTYTPEEVGDFADRPPPPAEPEPVQQSRIEGPRPVPMSYPVEANPTYAEPRSRVRSEFRQFCDQRIAAINDNWRNILALEKPPKDALFKPLCNVSQLGNHLVKHWIALGSADEAEVNTDGKRDRAKVGLLLSRIWDADRPKVEQEIGRYLRGLVAAAAEAAGVAMPEPNDGDVWDEEFGSVPVATGE